MAESIGFSDSALADMLAKRMDRITVAVALAAFDARICRPFKIPESDHLGWTVSLNHLVEVDGSIVRVDGYARVRFATTHQDIANWIREIQQARSRHPQDAEVRG